MLSSTVHHEHPQKIQTNHHLPLAIISQKNSLSLAQKLKEQSNNKVNFRLVLKTQPRNPFFKISIQHPMSYSHVYNVFNIGGINQNAIRDRDYEESYFKTIFYMFGVEKVETRKNAVILFLKNLSSNQTPINYIIERYKSYGDQAFYELATYLEQFSKLLEIMKSKENPNDEKKKNDPPSKLIDFMGEKAYISKFASNKLICSRKALQLLDYDPEMFSVRAIKYQSVLEQFISAQNYQEILFRFMANRKLMILFLQNLITFAEFQNQTSMEFNDYLLARGNKKIYCRLKSFFPHPLAHCIEVLEVLSEDQCYPVTNSSSSLYQQKVKLNQQKIIKKEIQLLSKIVKIPKNQLQENQHKIAGHKCLQVQQMG